MTARAWQRGEDHDGLLHDLRAAEADLDTYENGIVPLEDRSLSTQEELTIEAARSGIIMLVRVIEDIKAGKSETFNLKEIGRAIAADGGSEQRDITHPNWYEKVCLAKRQEELLRSTRKLLVMTHEVLREEGRSPTDDAVVYVEDMLSELNDYAPAPEL